MRMLLVFFVVAFIAAAAAGQTSADVYDEIWVKECIRDNQYEGQTSETIRIYCACMNEKMSTQESRSITAWEKTHPEEMELCARVAGWKGR